MGIVDREKVESIASETGRRKGVMIENDTMQL